MSDQEQSHSSVNAWEDDGGDIWDDGDSISYDRAIAEKEWSRLHETFGNTGYREGIEEGKEGTLQQGFNQGWSEGVNYGHELGRLRGLISPLLEYVRSSETESTPSASHHPLSKLSVQEKNAWIERASELVKELTEIDIAKVFDKAYFDDGRGPSHKAKAAAAGAAAEEEGSSKSGCCGGTSLSSSSNGDACCKKSDSSTSTDGGASACQSKETQPSQSGCSSKGNGACASKQSEVDGATDGSDRTKDGEWSSRPEQVIIEYRNRVCDLLKEAGLESLIDSV
ncbi:hypothetical protein BGZ67_003934 [Mortierella alpina]|nr:hypothetical protein BGZ67_003934 [Mortierella alpina]